MFFNKTKRYKAPKWFLELNTEAEDLRRGALHRFGVGPEWMNMQADPNTALNNLFRENAGPEVEFARKDLFKASIVIQYMYARFRYEKELFEPVRIDFDEGKGFIKVKELKQFKDILSDMKKIFS